MRYVRIVLTEKEQQYCWHSDISCNITNWNNAIKSIKKYWNSGVTLWRKFRKMACRVKSDLWYNHNGWYTKSLHLDVAGSLMHFAEYIFFLHIIILIL